MPDPTAGVPERMDAAFKALVASAEKINAASDELARPVAALDSVLARLNVGVECWTEVNRHIDDDGSQYWSHDVGYTRHARKWCLAIRTVEGDERFPESARLEVWPFNEAPRYLRAKAVDKLPELIAALVKATDAAAKRLEGKVAPAEALASAARTLANSKKQTRG